MRDLFGHSRPRIADGDHDVLARHDFSPAGGVLVVRGDVGRRNRQRAPVGHGLVSVDSKVHEDEVQLGSVSRDIPKSGSQLRDELDVFTDKSAQRRAHFLDQIVQVDNCGCNDLLAGKCQELTGQQGASLRRLANRLKIGLRCFAARQL